MYAEFEELYGLLNHAIEIYDRMVAHVDPKYKMQAYNIYIAKVSHYLGITKTRPVFENAIENLPEKEKVQMGLRLAHLERKLSEIDRARAIYMHISQYSDPRFDDYDLWKVTFHLIARHGKTSNCTMEMKKPTENSAESSKLFSTNSVLKLQTLKN